MIAWLVEEGEYVEKDQEIAEVDSDKATLALPAEASGAIKILVEEGGNSCHEVMLFVSLIQVLKEQLK